MPLFRLFFSSYFCILFCFDIVQWLLSKTMSCYIQSCSLRQCLGILSRPSCCFVWNYIFAHTIFGTENVPNTIIIVNMFVNITNYFDHQNNKNFGGHQY